MDHPRNFTLLLLGLSLLLEGCATREQTTGVFPVRYTEEALIPPGKTLEQLKDVPLRELMDETGDGDLSVAFYTQSTSNETS